MRSVLLLCICLVGAASAMMEFHHPFRHLGMKCFDERGMFYKDRVFHDGYYVYKNLYVFPPGHPKFSIPVHGFHHVVVESHTKDGGKKRDEPYNHDANFDMKNKI